MNRKKLATSEVGASSIEYALLASLIALAILVTVAAFGEEVRDLYARIAEAMPSLS